MAQDLVLMTGKVSAPHLELLWDERMVFQSDSDLEIRLALMLASAMSVRLKERRKVEPRAPMKLD